MTTKINLLAILVSGHVMPGSISQKLCIFHNKSYTEAA